MNTKTYNPISINMGFFIKNQFYYEFNDYQSNFETTN